MKELSYRESTALIHVLRTGVVSTGLINALETLGAAGSDSENQCALSICKSISEGNDLQTSFQNANPPLPGILTRLIIAGYRNSVLDYALKDAHGVLADAHQSHNVDEELCLLAERYEQMSASMICGGCLEREFLKLITEAKNANASVVELEQVGESFLCKRFVSAEVVLVKQMTHSLVYKSILDSLDSACRGNGVLKTESRIYKIEKGKSASYFVIENNNNPLQIVFKGHRMCTESLNKPVIKLENWSCRLPGE